MAEFEKNAKSRFQTHFSRILKIKFLKEIYHLKKFVSQSWAALNSEVFQVSTSGTTCWTAAATRVPTSTSTSRSRPSATNPSCPAPNASFRSTDHGPTPRPASRPAPRAPWWVVARGNDARSVLTFKLFLSSFCGESFTWVFKRTEKTNYFNRAFRNTTGCTWNAFRDKLL